MFCVRVHGDKRMPPLVWACPVLLDKGPSARAVYTAGTGGFPSLGQEGQGQE